VAPTLTCTPSGTRWTSAGATVTYTASVQNNDATGTGSTFDVSAALPSGWSAPVVRTPTIAPGGTVSVAVPVTAAAGAAAALYTLTLRASNTADVTKNDTTSALVSIASTLAVTVGSMQASYTRPSNGTSYAPITTLVTSRGLAVPGAAIALTVRGPTGVVTSYNGVADVNGKMVINVPYSIGIAAGTYTVSVSATLGTISASASTTFLLR
jgi:hypothetical protein